MRKVQIALQLAHNRKQQSPAPLCPSSPLYSPVTHPQLQRRIPGTQGYQFLQTPKPLTKKWHSIYKNQHTYHTHYHSKYKNAVKMLCKRLLLYIQGIIARIFIE